ncbi:MAG: alpha/beta hydrolase [Bacteroidota bacterium]
MPFLSMYIYKQYDKDTLDWQYNNRLHVPEYATHLERWTQLSNQTEKKLPLIKDIAYGRQPRQLLDIYPSAKPHSKILIFIHGGYWQRLDKSDFHFIAEAFSSYGITTVLVTYPLAPAASMDQIVSSCSEAVSWVYKNISQYSADPEQIYIAGHSAGGHLVAMMMTQEYFGENISSTIIKGACAVSGLYNLVPIQLSFVNDVVNMDKEMALRNSPVLLQPITQCPLLLAAGTDESDEFRDQTRELYSSWKDKDIPIEYIELQKLNHYSTVEAMADTDSPLHLAIRKLMQV